MTTTERENMAELIAVLRTFPIEELTDNRIGRILGHYVGLAWMVLMQRHNVIKALENYAHD